MSIAQSMLPEFDQEMASTRKLLERVPAEQTAWKPHEKSWSLGDLSMHLANLITWTQATLDATEFDVDPPGGPAFTPPAFSSPRDTLKAFDENVSAARESITKASDQDLMVAWTLKKGGQAMFTMPRAACLRLFILNHLIHHRGQLTVYLRQCDVPLPSIYGPTADEPM